MPSSPRPGLIALGCLLAAGCSDRITAPGADPVDYDAISPVVFSQHIQPIFEGRCNAAACHNGTDSAAGLDLTSYETLAVGSADGTVVIPAHPDRSHLYLHLSGEMMPAMPATDDLLADDAVRLFRRWIEDGARYDSGAAMYSGVSKKAFVACQGENAVAVLDLDPAMADHGRLVGLLDIEAPHSVFVDGGSNRLYVSRFETASDNIQVYDTVTLQKIAWGRAGSYPALMQLTPDRTQLWITNFDATSADNRIRVLDPVTLAPYSVGSFAGSFDIPTVQQPHGLAMSSDGSLIYVTGIQSANVVILETRNAATGEPKLVDYFDLPASGTTEGQQPQQCVLSGDESHLFVSALGSDRVYVLDTSLPADPWVAQVTVGDGPWHLALSQDGSELWVANWLGESVSVVDVHDPLAPAVVATLQPAHPMHAARAALERPMGIAFSPDGTRVYVTNTNDTNAGVGHHPPPEGQKNPGSVAIFNAATREVLAVSEVPNFARFISFAP